MSGTWWLALFAVAVALAACGGGDGASAPQATPCPVESPRYDASILPKDLPIESWSTVQEARVVRGFVTVTSVATEPIVELYPPIARTLLDERYRILSGDNEGFEAEIFFKRGDSSGNIYMREGPCSGQVTIRMVHSVERKQGRSS